MAPTLHIAGGFKVGDGRCFVIAEAGINHNGSIERALEMVETAAKAGADAVKFQTFRAIDLVTADAPKAAYQAKHSGDGTQLEMLRDLELSREDHMRLIEQTEQHNILFLSTPFDESSIDLLAELGVVAFKIASGEITNLPFLRHVAGKGKPIVLSTGMSNLSEVADAVATIEDCGNREIALLHCLSQYPADPAQVNLRAMETLRIAFGYPAGYSDHTAGVAITYAAVALGAAIIEKHFTLDRAMPGPDHQASLEPEELSEMIACVRQVEAARGDGRKRRQPGEENTAEVARKSLVARAAIAEGDIITSEQIDARRPGTGISPGMIDVVVGRRAAVQIEAGKVLEWTDLL